MASLLELGVGDLGFIFQERPDHEILCDIVDTIDDGGGKFDVRQAFSYRPIGEDETPVKAVTTDISSPWGTKLAGRNRTF